MYVCVSCVHLVLMEARRRYQLSWNWSYRLLGAIMWGADNQTQIHCSVVSALKHQAISLAPSSHSFIINFPAFLQWEVGCVLPVCLS